MLAGTFVQFGRAETLRGLEEPQGREAGSALQGLSYRRIQETTLAGAT